MKKLTDVHPTLQFAQDAPDWVFTFASLGAQVRTLLEKYLEASGGIIDRFGQHPASDLKELASALETWKDAQAAVLLEHLLESSKDKTLDIHAVSRWVLLHKDDPDGVTACMDLIPPREIEIVRLLPRTGSQKLVFEATWRRRQKRVVLKKITGTAQDIARISSHERSSHPLSIRHPNIIETYFESNGSETFLVEEWLPEVLKDNWSTSGLQQTANLFYSLVKAIEKVHELGFVHGDVKPDNIGKKDDRFVLLDFGICRPKNEFTADTTATGSLRTRAPELLANPRYVGSPETADIWAIGATIFNFQEGRFPLISRDEVVPRISHPVEREEFERKITSRAQNEWDGWVHLEHTRDPIKSLILACLQCRPELRPNASKLRERIEADLGAYIPRGAVDQDTSFAPIVELKQLARLAAAHVNVRLIPGDDLAKLRNRVTDLKNRITDQTDSEAGTGFDPGQELRKLEQLLSA